MPAIDDLVPWAKGAAKGIVSKNRWVPLFWSKGPNWGDALNPQLVEWISNIPARFERSRFVHKNLCIGSILQLADEWSTIWGSGLISADALPKAIPENILAVRGPLTRNVLNQHGIRCPPVFGDPALVLPRYLPMERIVQHSIGIVPHYTDKNHAWIQFCRESGARIIDIEADVTTFVQEIVSCEKILSSSLHGLICADAYGIPNHQITLGNEVIGEGFKFRDYYSSLNHHPEPAIHPSNSDSPESIGQASTLKKLDIDLDLLMSACPFANH